MWQQRGHTQRGVTRQYAQLAAERGLAVAFFVDPLAQFNGGLIAEGITNNHHQTLIAVAILQWFYPMIEERMLIRHTGDFPVIKTLFCFHAVAPTAAQLIEVPVGITLLHGLIEFFDDFYMSAMGSCEVVSVGGIEAIQLTFIGLVQRLGADVVEASCMVVAQREQLNGCRQRGIEQAILAPDVVILVARGPVIIQTLRNDAREHRQIARVGLGNCPRQINNNLPFNRLKGGDISERLHGDLADFLLDA